MKHFLPFYFLISILTCAQSCKDSSNKTIDSDKEVTLQDSEGNQKTQALILTQDFPYDDENKDKIAGDYISNISIKVPLDLSPQNKWFMFEGPVLENDLVAYRYYADSRHRFDIYGKLVSDLVMDTVSWDYHNIMDWGSDILKVGNTLGLGSPAVYYNDSLYYLSVYDEKVIEEIESVHNTSTIRTTFSGMQIENHRFDLIQDWSLSAGDAASEITLKIINGKLPEGMRFATGFVKHIPEIIESSYQDVFYAMNWGKQSFHEERLGMAIMANQRFKPVQVSDNLSHTYIFNNAENEVTYRFISAWEKDQNNVTDNKGFQMLIERACKSLK